MRRTPIRLLILAGTLAAAVSSPTVAQAPPTCFGETATIVGTGGNDVLRGTVGDDVIWGGPGDDYLTGGRDPYATNPDRGDDLICAGRGDDAVRGWWGADQVDGGEGADSVNGDLEADLVRGGPGADEVEGDFSPESADDGDVLRGGTGPDMVVDEGIATWYGGPGNDLIGDWGCATGGEIYAGRGDDEINSYWHSYFGVSCGRAAGRSQIVGGIGQDEACVDKDMVSFVERVRITRADTGHCPLG